MKHFPQSKPVRKLQYVLVHGKKFKNFKAVRRFERVERIKKFFADYVGFFGAKG